MPGMHGPLGAMCSWISSDEKQNAAVCRELSRFSNNADQNMSGGWHKRICRRISIHFVIWRLHFLPGILQILILAHILRWYYGPECGYKFGHKSEYWTRKQLLDTVCGRVNIPSVPWCVPNSIYHFSWRHNASVPLCGVSVIWRVIFIQSLSSQIMYIKCCFGAVKKMPAYASI